MTLKKVVMANQTTGVCRYVVDHGPHVAMATRRHEKATKAPADSK